MDSAPAGATRMGSRSSTRHGGPAQVFVGPVRKWRKVWSPVATSAPSPSACRVVLYKWNPLTASNGGAKDDATVPEETTPTPTRPVKYIPIAAVIQKNKDEIARKAAEEAEAQAQAEKETQEANETTTTATDMVVDTKEPEPAENDDEMEDPPAPIEPQTT
ncbi:unnamed protein product [Calypogeia fissa]